MRTVHHRKFLILWTFEYFEPGLVSENDCCRLTRLPGSVLSPIFGLFAGTQLLPEIPGQCEFFVVQSWRLPDHDFHHLDVFINLADQKRQLACVQNRLEHDASLDDSIHDCRLSQTRMEFLVSTAIHEPFLDHTACVTGHTARSRYGCERGWSALRKAAVRSEGPAPYCSRQTGRGVHRTGFPGSSGHVRHPSRDALASFGECAMRSLRC